MERIVYPLNVGDQGTTVVNLQDTLQALVKDGILVIADVSKRDALLADLIHARSAQRFDKAVTAQTIKLFQKQQGVQVTGQIDKATADALNQALLEHGLLASTISDKEFTVTGTVSRLKSGGVGGLRVEIVDRYVGKDVLLAQATTDSTGHYITTFLGASLEKTGKIKPDLQARIFFGEELLAVSKVIYEAEARSTLDAVVPDHVAILPSRFENTIAQLTNHLTGKLVDLQEDDRRQDISYLSRKTGIEPDVLRYVVKAHQASEKNSADYTIAPAFFFVLLQKTGVFETEKLFRNAPAMVEETWKKAISEGEIPKKLEVELPKALEAYSKIAAREILTAPLHTDGAALKDILSISGITDEIKQNVFAKIQLKSTGSSQEFWTTVNEEFGNKLGHRIKINRTLATLTLGNANLIQKLNKLDRLENREITHPSILAELGFHRSSAWKELLADSQIPAEIKGESPEERREKYAQHLASQVRKSYPTASIAEMLRCDREISPRLTFAGKDFHDGVVDFLKKHQLTFDIGKQPIRHYLAKNDVQLETDHIKQVERIQRIQNITPDDKAMIGLLKQGIDSSLRVARYDRVLFIQSFSKHLGSEKAAAYTYDHAANVHSIVVNLATNYASERNGISVGTNEFDSPLDWGSLGGYIPSAPAPHQGTYGDVIAYPTLEELVGSMDFSSCEHSVSILSPAAYLVDLLQFLDRDEDEWQDFISTWKQEHNVPYPFLNQGQFDSYAEKFGGKAPDSQVSPYRILTERRPDIPQLSLTKENTQITIPYIDIVNETLEYFVANAQSDIFSAKPPLAGYQGHDSDDVSPEDLLASPQFIIDDAYVKLRDALFPYPLPFNQPLESIRKYFQRFEVPLQSAMECLRQHEKLNREDSIYGWCDILMEELQLSRQEFELLTSDKAPLWQKCGLPVAVTDSEVITKEVLSLNISDKTGPKTVSCSLSNAKLFCRHIGITYEELAAILTTKFINPDRIVVDKLVKLDLDSHVLAAMKEARTSGAAWRTLLSPAAKEKLARVSESWVKDDGMTGLAAKTIVLVDEPDADPNNFDAVEIKHADGSCLEPVELFRLLIFIRLWKKTGWRLEDIDVAICSLSPQPVHPPDDSIKNIGKRFEDLLPRLGVAFRCLNTLGLNTKKDLQPLLTCWSHINAHGANSLYRQLFLSPAILAQDSVFKDEVPGQFLPDKTVEKLIAHREVLRSACGVSDEELSLILADLGFDADYVEVEYEHPKEKLDPEILKAAPGICYNPKDKVLGFSGMFREKYRKGLKDLTGLPHTFQAAADKLYKASKNRLTNLTLANVSAIYRRAWLARKLKISVREFLLLRALTGLDPFAPIDPTNPAILKIIDLMKAMRAQLIKLATALYLFWNHDLSGKSVPDNVQVTVMARKLRNAFIETESEFVVTSDTDGALAQEKMQLVYGSEVTNLFLGILNNTVVTEVNYSHIGAEPVTYASFRRSHQLKRTVSVSYKHHQPDLEPEVFQVSALLSYNDSTGQLTFSEEVSEDTVTKLKAAGNIISNAKARISFNEAVDRLRDMSVRVLEAKLEQEFLEAAYPGKIFFDESKKLLCFTGAMSVAIRDALKAANGILPSDDERVLFMMAVDRLYAENQKVLAADLPQEIVDVAPGRITYDEFRKCISWAGLMSEQEHDNLKASAIALNDDSLQLKIDQLYEKNQETLTQFFKRFPDLKQLCAAYCFFIQLRTEVEYPAGPAVLDASIVESLPECMTYDGNDRTLVCLGVLSDADLKGINTEDTEFKDVIKKIRDENAKKIKAFFEDNPELTTREKAYCTASNSPASQRAVLLEAFLPAMKMHRKRTQALELVAAVAQVDMAFARRMLESKNSDVFVLHSVEGTNRPGIDDLLILEESALPVRKWKGYLEVPVNALYNLQIESSPGDTLTIRLDGKLLELLQDNSRWTNKDRLELYAGTMYALEIDSSATDLIIRWERQGSGWEPVPSRYLYSQMILDRFRDTYLRFLKAASISAAFKCNEDEFVHFACHQDYRINPASGTLDPINGVGWLNCLANAPTQAKTALNVSLFKPLLALLDHARIKAEIGLDESSLIKCLADPQAATAKPDGILFRLTRWDESSFKDLLSHFSLQLQDIGHLNNFCRIHGAFAIAKKMGLSAKVLIAATTNDPTGEVVRDFQNALRARYEAADWREVVRPINDELRALRRDALVTFILHKMRLNPLSAHINTPEKLFEYFLMDVQMAPCMQTSRIRHALSSVQLFIERCLMNLEPRVSPAAIRAEQWDWRKRYRVWEANRKVFLYPENWLEPELRDNQSPIFKDAMSTLLQQDITDEAAVKVMGNYLTGLDEIAKLEPSGLYHDEQTGIDHVVARTYGASRKYFYRTYDNDLADWSPWEQIKLDIEDNPVLPVVWHTGTLSGSDKKPSEDKGRLLLFWLRIMKDMPGDQASMVFDADDDTPMANLTKNDANKLAQNAKYKVKPVLCWSEFQNGTWQAARTSQLDNPLELAGSFDLAAEGFDRSLMAIDALQYTGITGEHLIVFLNLPRSNPSTHSEIPTNPSAGKLMYTFHNNSSPIEAVLKHDHIASWDDSHCRPPAVYKRQLHFYNTLSVQFSDFIYVPIEEDIISPINKINIKDSCSNLENVHTAPFFVYDDKRVFWVKPSVGGNVEWGFPIYKFPFESAFHPFVGKLICRLQESGLSGIANPHWLSGLGANQNNLDIIYHPLSGGCDVIFGIGQGSKEISISSDRIDIKPSYAYSNYNWELLLHIPITIALHLSRSQRFAEAQRWFHMVFNPMSTDTAYQGAKRYWRFIGFHNDKMPITAEQAVRILSGETEGVDPQDIKDVEDSYTRICEYPFQPHRVARVRPIAYQYYIVMKYLDNLIAWGDSLFQQDTVESINEATQLYVLAANILGPRPQRVPPRGSIKPLTYDALKEKGLGVIGNAMVDLEALFPFVFKKNVIKIGKEGAKTDQLRSIGRALYFCVPRNGKLLTYWDTVADRLFKIRHCMNIAGIVRPLALFDPPIDPGMLVKAAAAGIDIASIVSGLNQPVGPMRALPLMQKALELCGEVRGLGNALLSALEKGDSENLALIRQKHEISSQKLAKEVRFLQWKSAQESTKSLLTSRATALERLHYYQRLLGLPPDANAPEVLTLSDSKLNADNFDDAYESLVGQYDKQLATQAYPELRIAGGSSSEQQANGTTDGHLYLNTNEDADLNDFGPKAHIARQAAMAIETLHGPLALIPDLNVDLHYWGLGGHATVFGGTPLTNFGRFLSGVLNFHAAEAEYSAARASKTAGYERRSDEWMLQHNLAAHEVMQIGRQILTSSIAEEVARHEYENTITQISNAQEVDDVLRSKFTNEQLYGWMQTETMRLYHEYYRFAVETARRAERAMKRELMRPELDAQDFVKFNYWDGGRKGLLSGEALHFDLKRMEMAYHDSNKRELELTRHVSLRQLSPMALLKIRTSGTCMLTIPEWLYDMDCPGHYLRRIKSVAVSIPAVVGPYTSLNCTLTLLRSSVRKSPVAGETYQRQGTEDGRFIDYAGTVDSIVTSGANSDSGLFETNLHEERYLPFEGAGAISTWKLDLPQAYRAFDYSSMSDVILHIRYTARQGVEPGKVMASLDELFGPDRSDLALLLNVRQEFPSAWATFTADTSSPLIIPLTRQLFPYFTQGKTITAGKPIVVNASDLSRRQTLDVMKEITMENTDILIGKDQIPNFASDASIYMVIPYNLS